MSTSNDLDRVRAAAQQLHGVISDAAAKRGEVIKADLQAIPQKTKSVIESIKASMGAQKEPTKKSLAEAVKSLEATQKHAAESLKSSGKAFQTSIRQTLADARASVQKISEAVAAGRSAESKHTRK